MVEKLVQVLIRKKELEEPFKIEEVIIFEELPAKEEGYTVTRIKAEEKPVKKALLKILEKAKYNAKYLEEKIPVEKYKRSIYARNYGIF